MPGRMPLVINRWSLAEDHLAKSTSTKSSRRGCGERESRASNALTQAGGTEELVTWLLRRAEDGDNAALQQALAVFSLLDRPAEVIVV